MVSKLKTNIGACVSIPHRYAENIYSFPPDTFPLYVSIPHRYAENQKCSKLYLLIISFQFLIGTLKTCFIFNWFGWKWVFQFLIGTLKTIAAGYVGDAEVMFQFLIGTLKTFPLLFFPLPRYRFQFLIGTLKTRFFIWYIQSLPRVSIPHRYAENTYYEKFWRWYYLSFNSS